MSDDCLFCRIAAGEIDAEIVRDGDEIVAFEDINPQAPTHILVIPRTHISTINDVTEEHEKLLGRMVTTAKRIARDREIADAGYRLVLNCNRQAGQSVFHIHLHLLGGRTLSWPPG